jgi:4-amino-4-deoxy-L-arabinose transferase
MPVQASGTERRFAIGLIVLYTIMYLLPLGVRPLVAPDEVRYGEIAREMIESGNWVSPHLNGVRYFEKPIMGHWLNAGSFEIFGFNAYALRLPSAIAAGLTALLIFWLTVRFANRRSALLAAGIFLTTFEVFGVGTFAVLDTYLSFFLTAALVSYYFAYESSNARERQFSLIACGCACGCALLTKGFLGLVIPAIVIGPFLALERRWRALITNTWIPALAACAVILPWAVMVHLREPDFWRYFIVVEHLQRFAGEDAQHAEPWWYFIARMPIAGFPWVLLLPVAWRGLAGQQDIRTLRRYLVCWAVLPFVFFSLSRGKLMTYVLPCFAPLSIWLAIGLERAAARNPRLKIKWPAAICMALLGLSLAVLLAAQGGLLDEAVYRPDEWLRFGVTAGAFLVGVLATFLAIRSRSAVRQLLLVGCSALPLFVLIDFTMPARVLDDKAPGAFIASQGPFDADAILISDASLFGSLSWFLNRDDVYVFGQSEVAYGLSYPEAAHRALDARGLGDLLAQNVGRREIVILCKDSDESQFVEALPEDATRAQLGELVMWRIDRS